MATSSSESDDDIRKMIKFFLSPSSSSDFEDSFADSFGEQFKLWTVKAYPFTVEGVYGFLKDNYYIATDPNSIMFGVIMVKLIDLKLIIRNDESDFALDLSDQQKIPEALDEGKLEMFSSFAKTMILVALFVHSKCNFRAESDSFRKSFRFAKNTFFSKWEFSIILEMLIFSKKFTEISKIITVGDIKSNTGVLEHKLTGFQTPGLVKEALKKFPYTRILSKFDPVAVRNYKNFDRAGFLAYVASGPLAKFCKGEVDVMKGGVENIPDDLPLCDLKAIQLPYHKETIKRAYIILKETNYKFGKWNQGESAMRSLNPDDLKFREIVRAVIEGSIQKSATNVKTAQTSSQEGKESSKAFGPWIVKDYPFTVEGVCGFLEDNNYNAADLNSIVFGVIVVKLVDLKLIIPNDESVFALDLSDKNTQQKIPEALDEAKLEMFSSFAKTMLLVALHVYCKCDFRAESDGFRKSFCYAKESFISELEFNTILKMLIVSRKLTEITKIITVGDIKSNTKVLKHKLTYFPTPGLIRAALKQLPYKMLISKFDPVAVRNYINFDKAGILAHVASGPLALYCEGEVDVMKGGVENIPEDLPLCALKAIQLPYHKETIKKAYIILKETNYNFGKWYQGENAMSSFHPNDLQFRAIVRAVIKASMQKSATNVKTAQDVSQTSSQEGEEFSGAIQKSATNLETAVYVFEASSQDGGESSGAIQKSATNLKTAVDVSETSCQDGGESSGNKS